MSQFLESIACVEYDFPLLTLHQDRVDRTFAAFYPGKKPHQLWKFLQAPLDNQLHKFRVIYDANSVQVESDRYTPRSISSLRLVEAKIDYSFKFLDRTMLTDLVRDSQSDDIIIVKDGLITDSSYSNLAFYDGDKWLTPRTPLLAGVRRTQLLSSGRIVTADILASDIYSFEKVSLINAMLDLSELEVDLGNVQKNH